MKAYGINRAVLFFDGKEALNRYKVEHIDGMIEQIIMPYSELGISIVRKLGEKDINNEAGIKVYGEELRQAQWKYADYYANGRHVFIMILNDAEKEERLKTYLDLTGEESAKNIEIVCIKEQEYMMQVKFPNVTIRTINFEEI